MTQSSRPPSLAAAALRWQRDSFRARGFVGSFRYLAGQFVECVKDSLPERRRSRFGDIDYDCDHAVDTTWARLPLSVRLREVFSERLYQPTVEEEFAAIMQHSATIDLRDIYLHRPRLRQGTRPAAGGHVSVCPYRRGRSAA